MSFDDSLLPIDRVLATMKDEHVIPEAMERSLNTQSRHDFNCYYLEYGIEDGKWIMGWNDEEDAIILLADSNSTKCIRGSIASHTLRVYEDEWKDMDMTEEVIDLDVSGKRWEGGVKDGNPFGYGILYDEEGGMEYQGFMMNGMRMCYGVEYDAVINRVQYEGGYYDNKRFGNGVLFDRRGNVAYRGMWKNDQLSLSEFDGETINSTTEMVSIPDNSFPLVDSFILPRYLYSLKQIVIGNESFVNTQRFELNGLDQLQSVTIGADCCSSHDSPCGQNAVFRCVHCRHLRSIQIGNRSFRSYSSIELSDLSSFQSLIIGSHCFSDCDSFQMTS